MKTITRRAFALFIAVTLCAGVLIFSASADGDAFRIKETEATFSNFKAAMDAAQDGQTVELLDDAEYHGGYDARVELSDGRAVTLDLRGKTLSGDITIEISNGDLIITSSVTEGGKLCSTGGFTASGENAGFIIKKGVSIEKTGGSSIFVSGKAHFECAGDILTSSSYLSNAVQVVGIGTTADFTGGSIKWTGSSGSSSG